MVSVEPGIPARTTCFPPWARRGLGSPAGRAGAPEGQCPALFLHLRALCLLSHGGSGSLTLARKACPRASRSPWPLLVFTAPRVGSPFSHESGGTYLPGAPRELVAGQDWTVGYWCLYCSQSLVGRGPGGLLPSTLPGRDQQSCSAGVRPGLPVANSCLFPWTRRCRGPVFCQALCPETPSSRKAGGDYGLLSPDVLEQHTHSQQLGQEERMACPQPQAGGRGQRGQMPPQGSLHPKRPPPSQA